MAFRPSARALATLAVSAFLLAPLTADDPAPASASPERVYSNSHAVYVTYQVRNGVSHVTNTVLYVTADEGKNWKQATQVGAGTTPEGDSYLEWQAPSDGVYGFETVAANQAGLTEPPPANGQAPSALLVVDTVAPALTLQYPKGGETVKPGAAVVVSWECKDDHLGAEPVALECSGDHGVSWRPINGHPSYPASGMKTWVPPAEGGPEWLVRARGADLAENETVRLLAQSILVQDPDSPPPTPPTPGAGNPPPTGGSAFWSTATPPSLMNRRDFDIDYHIAGATPQSLAAIVLWYTVDGGKTWKHYGRDADLTPPIRFVAPGDGDYGFYLVALTSSWRASRPDPQPDTPCDRITRVDTTVPVTRLLSPSGGESWAAGSTQSIVWEAKDLHLIEKPIALAFSMDEGKTWHPVAEGIENSGRSAWTVPSQNGPCRVRLTAADASGNMGIAESDIAIDNAGLSVTITDVTAAKPPPPPTPAPPQGTDTRPPPSPPSPAKIDLESAKAAYDKGCLLRAEGRLDDAGVAFVEAVKNNPKFLDALNDLGCVLFEQEKYELARTAYRQALDVDSADPEVLVNLAFAEVKLGADADAFGHLSDLCGVTSSASPIVSRAVPVVQFLRDRFQARGDRVLAADAEILLGRMRGR